MSSGNGQFLLPTAAQLLKDMDTNVKYYGEIELRTVNFAIAK